MITKSFRFSKLRKIFPDASEFQLERMTQGLFCKSLPACDHRGRLFPLRDLNAYMDLVFPVQENGHRRNMVDVLSDNNTAREIRESIEKNLGSLDSGINAPENMSNADLLALLPSRYANSSLSLDYANYAREYISKRQEFEAINNSTPSDVASEPSKTEPSKTD